MSDVDEDVTVGGILRGFGWGESLCKGAVGFTDKLEDAYVQ